MLFPKLPRRRFTLASITFKHVEKTYPGNVTVAPDLNLEIQAKEFVILVGPSGCGKSTTLRMIAGLEDITSGELYIGDRVVNDVAHKDRDIAMVFQNYALYPHMTVYKNIAFGLTLQKISQEEIDRRVHEAARAMDLEHLLNRKPKALSGGQRQRVALGRAMVRNPAVFLLDELLSNLDAKLRAAMRAEISRLHKRLQTTFVYVTHDQTEAMTMGDRVVVMKNGIIQQNDTPQTLYGAPCNLFAAGFIGSPQMNFLDAVIAEENGKLVAKTCGSSVTLPERMGREVLGSYVGKTVVLGVRPEDVDVAVGPNYDLDATIEIAELMGAEIHLHLDCQGSKVVARAPSTYPGRVGDSAKPALPNIRLLPLSAGDRVTGYGHTGDYILPAAIQGNLTVFAYDRYVLLDPGQAYLLAEPGEYTVQAVSDGFYVLLQLRGELVPRLLAERLEVSAAHLGRVFTKKIGISPGKYITRVRVE